MFGSSIHDRTTSGFPLSISTALAMESIFDPRTKVYDPERVVPPKIIIDNYSQIWINTSTLYRNFVAATEPSTVLTASTFDVAKALEAEMEVIESLFKNEGRGVCVPYFYNVDYSSVFFGVHQSIKRRIPSSKQQLDLMAFYEQVLKRLLKDTPTHQTNPELKPTIPNNSLILTHQPYDLLSHTNFKQLDLLESNTGKLKSKKEWGSKYYPVGKAQMTHLPFNKMLLMLFGDKSLIHPNIFKLRQLILECSVKRNWTPYTTRAKMIADLEIDIKEPYVLAVIRAIR